MNQPLLPGKTAGNNLLARVLVVIVAAGLLALGIAFSIIFLAIAFVVGGLFIGRVMWKTRHLRKQMREAAAAQVRDPHEPAAEAPTRNRIIEGEVVRADDKDPQT